MAEIVNLRLVRKARQRQDKATLAAANRARFGQPKSLRSAAEDEAERARRSLDGHRLDSE